MKNLQLFAQIAKIDESRHEVWGVATAEVIDKEGEIFDYASSKPYFEKWSDEIAKASDGKSLGNVREMHAPSAVGKLVSIDFDDDLRQIRVGARIVDGTAWQKCAQGVYTGFSIGGSYVKTWKDGECLRFTANPVEISVVDNPCVPGAHFTAVKADGTCEVRKFKAAPRGDQTRKIGARHSKETKAHLAAIKDCLDQMSQKHHEAADHMDSLLNDEDGTAARLVSAQIKKIPGAPRTGAETGEQNTMLDSNDKAQLEKAHANSASALAKLADVEEEVAGLRSEMESNNQEIQQSLSNLLQLVEKLVGSGETGVRAARTAVPTHTITKEDDARPSLAKSAGAGEASVHDLLKRTLQKPQPASVYLR